MAMGRSIASSALAAAKAEIEREYPGWDLWAAGDLDLWVAEHGEGDDHVMLSATSAARLAELLRQVKPARLVVVSH